MPFLFLGTSLLSACSGVSATEAELVSTERLPTIIAMTLEAQGVELSGAAAITDTTTPGLSDIAPAISPAATEDAPTKLPTGSPTQTPTYSPTSPPAATDTQRPSSTPGGASAPAVPLTSTGETPAGPTHTPAPLIPEARIQIYWIGERSKVTAPLQVITRLTSRVGKIVRIELYGEDGRVLARHLKTYHDLPWHVAGLNVELPFEISAAAEVGRLVVSAEDVYGRLVDLNSVNLILLSAGDTELNPATALWQRIVIEEPEPETLITGGTLVVSGLAQPESEGPLRVRLVAEDGRQLGERLAGVITTTPGSYGTFIVEVPYSVAELTRARLSVSEDGGIVSPIAHLASVEVLLSP